MFNGRKVNIVVAAAENGVISFKGAIPWDIPEERRRFAEITAGRTVIMGRKTLDSIGYPLRGRKNIVLTKKAHDIRAEITDTPIYISPNLEAAICMDDDEVFVIGGHKPFIKALPYVDVIWLTRVHQKKIMGDRMFNFEESEFDVIMDGEKKSDEYTFYKYTRKK